MGGIFWSMVFDWLILEIGFTIGVAISIVATVFYVRARAAPRRAPCRCADSTFKLRLTLRAAAYNRPARRCSGHTDGDGSMEDETFPDIGAMSDEELKEMIDRAHHRRSTRCPTSGACCTARSTSCGPSWSTACAATASPVTSLISGADVEKLTDILAGPVTGEDDPRPERELQMAVHCHECGFVNAEGANYCQKCGAYLGRARGRRRAVDADLQDRRDRRLRAGRHRGDGRGGGRRAGDPLRRRPLRRELRRRPGADEHRPDAGRTDLPRRRHRLAATTPCSSAGVTASTSTISARSTAPT